MGRWWHKRIETVDNLSACTWTASCWVSLNKCFDCIWWKTKRFSGRNIIITVVSYVRQRSLVRSTIVPGKHVAYIFKMTLFTLKMETAASVEMLVVFYQVTRCRMWEDHNIGVFCRCCHFRSQIRAVFLERMYWTRVLKMLMQSVWQFYFMLVGEYRIWIEMPFIFHLKLTI